MIEISGGASRLRPHVKTYKCREIIDMQLEKGIERFKCATLAEADLLGKSLAPDVLVAYPLVGPAKKAFIDLTKKYPKTQWSVLVDNVHALHSWNGHETPIDIFIDLDVGMHRTGIPPANASELWDAVSRSAHTFRGWHVYDGHIHAKGAEQRVKEVASGYEAVERLIAETGTAGSEVICGGSVTFPVHAEHAGRYLSPGTTLLWDYGYSSSFPDLPFEIAATLMTRVVSKPGANRLTLDAGHKAVASEMTAPSIFFPQAPGAQIVVHSEEHLVLEMAGAHLWQVGDVMYGVPYHICPTVALHGEAGVIENGALSGFWNITARDRTYSL